MPVNKLSRKQVVVHSNNRPAGSVVRRILLPGVSVSYRVTRRTTDRPLCEGPGEDVTGALFVGVFEGRGTWTVNK